MAQSQNTSNKKIYDGSIILPTDQTGTDGANQGDIVVWDTALNSSNGGVRAVIPGNGQTDMAHYLGVAEQNSVLNSLNDVLLTILVVFKNVVMLKTTASEVYKQFTTVYWNETADAQTITSSTNSGARTVPVGVVMLPQEQMMNGNLTITGAAGILVPVALTPHYPVALLA